MWERITEKILKSAPQLGYIAFFLIAIWLVVSQFLRFEEGLRERVDDAVAASVGGQLGQIQSDAAQAREVLDAISMNKDEVISFVDAMRSDLMKRSRTVDSTLGEIEKKLRVLGYLAEVGAEGSASDFAVLAQEAQNLAEALSYINQVKNDPDATSRSLESAGDAARKKEKFGLAAKLYSDAVAKDTENHSAKIELWCIMAETDAANRDSCLGLARELVLERMDSNLLARLVNTLIDLRRFEELKGYCEDILAKEPDPKSEIYVQGHRDLGAALTNLGQLQEAEDHYKTALVIDPDNENLLKAYVGLLTEKGAYREALSLAVKLVFIDPLDYRYYEQLGHIYNCLEDYDRASHWLNEARGLPCAPGDSTRIGQHLIRTMIRKELLKQQKEGQLPTY